ncbi:hypothetical protein TcasGA2_TC010550 [Tribolium castaneum]|uniref:Uncharacterized protein n=1 Tax=Tribolium castaneum TaxID=7070 RepID=D6WE25_TRICA|nr:hypothetical protein TcasGA2_TC010550 [Tribolium castaneum]
MYPFTNTGFCGKYVEIENWPKDNEITNYLHALAFEVMFVHYSKGVRKGHLSGLVQKPLKAFVNGTRFTTSCKIYFKHTRIKNIRDLSKNILTVVGQWVINQAGGQNSNSVSLIEYCDLSLNMINLFHTLVMYYRQRRHPVA